MVVAVVVDVERVGTRVNEGERVWIWWWLLLLLLWIWMWLGVVVVRNGEEGGGCLVSLGGLEHKLRALQTRQ